MSTTSTAALAATQDWEARFRENQPIDVALPGGGRLYLERPVPFVTLYRYSDGDRPYCLHGGEAAYCTLEGEPDAAAVAALKSLLVALSERFGGALLLEVHVDEGRRDGRVDVRTALAKTPAVGEALRERLDGLRLPHATLSAVASAATPPPTPIFGERTLERREVLHLGVGLGGFFLDGETGRPDPLLLRDLRTALHRAFRQTSFDFVRLQTSFDATHFDQLGHRRVHERVWDIDRELVEISTSFRFLELVTATNDDEALVAFREGGYRHEPVFHYRFLPVDPEALQRRLFNLPIDEVADPTLSRILRDKRDETFSMLDMIGNRGRDRFRYGSLQVFGGVDDGLLAIANSLLTIVPRRAPKATGRRVDAAGFLAAAQAELDYLTAQYPEARMRARVRDDFNSLMVSQGELNIGHTLNVPASRVDALIQHEVGTHVLTYWNGRAQPLSLLQTGTPGYEDLQEGIAVLSEWFVGGLTAARFRILAARVVAIAYMLRGHGFVATFELLHERHGLPEQSAFQTTARAFRGGGFTKDAVYLRGLVELLAYLGGGGRLEPLLIGKLQLSYAPLIDELTERGILRRAPLTPRWLRDDAAAGHPKLKLLRSGLSVFDLLPRRTA